MSGLQIFNAHPALYVGSTSTFDHPLFAIDSREDGGKTVGYVALLGHSIETTGVLGVNPSHPDMPVIAQWNISADTADNC